MVNNTSVQPTGEQKISKGLQQRTLRIHKPIGQTLGTALLVFCLFLGSGEIIARTHFFQSLFIAPGVGSQHRQFEIQLGRLSHIAAEQQGIDCIFLGNSMVWHGFDPVVFNQAYLETTQQDLQCFNFGVDGLTAASAGPLAEILVDRYKPKLLIFGADARDFAVPLTDRDTSIILDTAWVQYHLGNFSFEGWLYENSYLYQYRGSLQSLIRFRYGETFQFWNPVPQPSYRYGFRPLSRVDYDVKVPPSRTDETAPVQYYFRMLSDYQVRPENIEGFKRILNQAEEGVQILVVEMPFPATYLTFFGNGEQDYQKFYRQIENIMGGEQIPFIRWQSSLTLPDDSWADYSHLKENGAQIFSQWLAKEISSSNLRGILSDQDEAPPGAQ